MAKGRRNIKGTVCGILCAVAFFLLFGIVGGLECDTIAFKDAVISSAICLVVFFTSAAVGGFLE